MSELFLPPSRLRNLCAILLALACLVAGRATADAPATYYNSATGLTGDALRNALHNIIDGHTSISYSSTDGPLARLYEDPANSSNVILIYSRTSVSKGGSWNREHLWPRSRGIEESGVDNSDLFNLAPCDSSSNSSRGNLYFDESDTSDSGYRSPGNAASPQTSRDSNSWEPPASVKGDIARAMFYMDVRYDGSDASTTDLVLASTSISGSKMGVLSTLLQWHLDDPVDTAERARNDLIYTTYQGNRNPFIDHPEWISLIWGGGTTPTVILASADTSASFDAVESPVSSGQLGARLSQAAPAGGLILNFRITGGSGAADFSLSGPAGFSYNAAAGTGVLPVAAGAITATFSVVPVADGVTESPETLTFEILAGTGYQIGSPPTSTMRILDGGTPTGDPQLIAMWAFEGGTPTGPLAADTGNGELRFDGWTGTLNHFAGVSGEALALVGNTGNGSYVDFRISTVGFQAIQVGFSTRRSNTGFTSGIWKVSGDGGTTFTNLAGVDTAPTAPDTFQAKTLDLSSYTALNQSANVVLRYTLSGASAVAGNNRLDNFIIQGTPVVLPPDVPSLYSAEWVAAQGPGFTGAIAALDADPDGDGMTNLQEYGFGTRALLGDVKPWRIGFETLVDPATALPATFATIRFPARQVAGLSWDAEGCYDLENWSAENRVALVTVDLGNGFSELGYRLEFPTGQADKGFFRIILSTPD